MLHRAKGVKEETKLDKAGQRETQQTSHSPVYGRRKLPSQSLVLML